MYGNLLTFCALFFIAVSSDDSLLSDIISVAGDGVIFRTVCYDGIGCFYNGPPFYDVVERPLSPVPEDASRVRFYLFTRKRNQRGYVLRPEAKSLKNSPFDESLDTHFCISGYTSSLPHFAVQLAFKDKMLQVGDYNVIIPYVSNYLFGRYERAVANTRTIGARVAQLINFITNNTNAKAASFHISGWSLGSHIAGYAGKRIDKLGSIAALDAAGPYFHNVPDEVKLTRHDALFVQGIHVDGGRDLLTGYGEDEPYGDIDFYVNGGQYQPICSITSSLPNIGTVINVTSKIAAGICDHTTGPFYYYESIDDSECQFLGVSCESYDDFEAGKCTPQNSIVAEMGFHAKKIKNVKNGMKFYLRTHTYPPFCIKNQFD